MSEPVGRLNRRQLLQGASALGLGWALVPGPARAQKKTVKLAFIGPLTGGTASNGPDGSGSSVGNPPATTFQDTVACDSGGYSYFVTAVLSDTSTNPGQESVPSNTVSKPNG